MCGIILMVALSGVVSAQDDEGSVIWQWASGATASSEYESDRWSASQATGTPDVANCGDSPNAWASQTVNNEETLTVYFDTMVEVQRIDIYITYNPGTITSVALLTPDGEPVEIPDSAHTDTDCPGVFTLEVDPDFAGDFLSNAVQITLDQSSINNWTEIDAVQLIGIDYFGSDGGGDTGGNTGASDTVSVPDGPLGEQMFCNGNLVSENGVVFTVVQMRPNSNYIATVIGIDGFDPVLVVRDAQSGDGICNDDNPDAAYYEANLPTAQASASRRTASQPFNTGGYSAMANIELVVGGLNSQAGEFILILEQMILTEVDGAGDPLAINITPGMVLSGVSPSVYMFSVTNRLDPYIGMINSDYQFLVDGNGNAIVCDDAGNAACWGESSNLRNAWASRSQGRFVSGTNTSAMLTMPINADSIGGTYIPIMRSYEMRSYGDYVAVFHVGIGE